MLTALFFLIPTALLLLVANLLRRPLRLSDAPLLLTLVVSLAIGLHYVLLEGGPAYLADPAHPLAAFNVILGVLMLILQLTGATAYLRGSPHFWIYLVPPIIYFFVLGPILWQTHNRPDALLIDSVRAIVMALLTLERRRKMQL